MATEIEYLDRLSVLAKKRAVLQTALDNVRLEEDKIHKEMIDKNEHPTQYIGKQFKIGDETYHITNVYCIPHTEGCYTVTYKRILKKDGSLSLRCCSMDFKTFVNCMRHENDPRWKIVLV